MATYMSSSLLPLLIPTPSYPYLHTPTPFLAILFEDWRVFAVEEDKVSASSDHHRNWKMLSWCLFVELMWVCYDVCTSRVDNCVDGEW